MNTVKKNIITILTTLVISVCDSMSLGYAAQAQVSNKIETSESPSYFYIIHVKNSRLELIRQRLYQFTVKSSDVSENALMVSERPDRLAEKIKTDQFYQIAEQGSDNFKIDPPNIVFDFNEQSAKTTMAFVLLKFTKNKDSVTYLLGLLKNQPVATKLLQGEATIYVDNSTGSTSSTTMNTPTVGTTVQGSTCSYSWFNCNIYNNSLCGCGNDSTLYEDLKTDGLDETLSGNNPAGTGDLG